MDYMSTDFGADSSSRFSPRLVCNVFMVLGRICDEPSPNV